MSIQMIGTDCLAHRYSDGLLMKYSGHEGQFINNHIEYIDWSGANMETTTPGIATLPSGGHADTFLRNTFTHNGAAVALRPSSQSSVRLNRLSGQYNIQNDGTTPCDHCHPMTSAAAHHCCCRVLAVV